MPLPISVVVPSRNRSRLLVDTVASILAGEEVPTELLIVDQSDGPNHHVRALGSYVRGCSIRYLWPEPPGVSRARNLGAQFAAERLVAFVDDDILVQPNWLRALFEAILEKGDQAIVTGQVAATAPESPGAFAPSTVAEQCPVTHRGRIGRDVLYTNNMGLVRSVLESVGGFDVRLGPGTRFPSSEDNDLGYRLLEAGYQIAYVPTAIVLHRAWRTAEELVPLRRSYGRGQGAFYAKHLSLRDHYMLGRLCRDLAHGARSISDAVLHGRLAHVPAGAAYTLGVLDGVIGWYCFCRAVPSLQ